ncbi:ABC transporter substrate-binding protein [Aureispira anguillae]|uniref:Helical backbone metal receptor n=1 Tax=Aureispira anguillae TaxID=2864201 RepID=A0A916DQK0_9BACT|nr:helical backbone metal receptor [Aureispira anguillae]BDS10761.1 helical backbone metal receptor [Aureispira anguillae]
MKSVRDQMQALIQLPEHPKRIVSLVPSQTELLYYWGLGDRVVGITKFCIHPKEWYKTKTRVGGTKKINFDVIEALEPDLIIGNKEENEQKDIEFLKKRYPVWMSDMQRLDEVWDMMHSLGTVLNVEEQSKRLVQQLKTDFEDLRTTTKGRQWRVAYFIWKDPFMVAASNTFIDTVLQQAGFENAFRDFERYPEVGIAEIQQQQPELIFLSSEPYPFRAKHIHLFQQICPTARIEIVDGELFSWYGARLLHTVDYIKELQEKLEQGVKDN